MNNFTAKQKEIVARKLGYDGPMQGFDDFLNSSPALGMKYATITDKFATRMAKGGIVAKVPRRKFQAGGAVQEANFLNFLKTPNLTDAQIVAEMNKAGITPERGSAITGVPLAEVKSRYAAVNASNTGTTAGTGAATVAGTTYTTSGAVTSNLPSNWNTYNAADKINYFNNNNITESQLRAEGVPQADLDWMKGQGYTGSKATTGTTTAATTGATTAATTGTTTAATTGATTGATTTGTTGTTASATTRTNQDIFRDFLMTPNLTDAQIAIEMGRLGITNQQLADISGFTVDEVNKRYSALNSEDQFRAFLMTPNLTDAQIAAEMKRLNITSTQVAAITGAPLDQVQIRFDAATKTTTGTGTTTGTTGTTTGKTGTTTGTTGTTAGTTGTTAGTTGTTAGTGTTTGSSVTATTGAPNIPIATTYNAAQTTLPANAVAGQAATTEDATVTNIAAPTATTTLSPVTASTATAASAAQGVTDTLSEVKAEQGVLSDAAKAKAATQVPATTAVAGMEAAQGVAGTVQGAPTRTAQTGEMVSGSAVDMARVEEALKKTKAEEGTVTEDMTVQGQLNKLLTNFDAGAPPPWAAASMRAANAQMAARGLGASSMAGQAIIQATLEAATPIAAADAKVFETMGLQNLSNRQQIAMLVGQQRAAFLGQDFDQAFQTRVLNAARVADIANKNFDAQTQIAIENSRLANTMDIANLSAKNAVVLSKMAQMSQLETQNLSNLQQVAVENARAALTLDIKNLDNKQQTALFKAQEMNDALVSDAGFANAVSITNASNKLEADKVSASLAQSASQFNADQINKVNTANAIAANEISKFNAQQANARAEFNANMTTQINIANAKILAEVSTANTAATNAANAVNAKNATDLSASTYAQQSQTYRDLLEMSWKTGESEKDRATQIVAATLSANASSNAAKTTADSAALSNIAKAGIALLSNYDRTKASLTSIVDDIFGP